MDEPSTHDDSCGRGHEKRTRVTKMRLVSLGGVVLVVAGGAVLAGDDSRMTMKDRLPTPTTPSSLEWAAVCEPVVRDPGFLAFRDGAVRGPIALDSLTKDNASALFTAFGEKWDHPDAALDGRARCARGQVPDAARAHMMYTTCYKPFWSHEVVAALEPLALRRVDFSPPEYPGVVADFYNAFDRFPVRGRDLLVAGSISPWLEVLALAYGGAKSVVTSDYVAKMSEDERIETVLVEDLERAPRQFDAVASFSSIEHDGLGRYGDPIDPFGDFRAVEHFAASLKPHGILYLGVPVCCGQRGLIQRNSHRVYGRHRFRCMVEHAGFDHILTLYANKALEKGSAHYDHEGSPFAFTDEARAWQNQPIFVLRKRADSDTTGPS